MPSSMRLFLYLRRALGWLQYFVGGPRPLPVLPKGQNWVIYIRKSDPKWGMLCVRREDGTLIPAGRSEPFQPTDEWVLATDFIISPEAKA